MAAPPDYKSSLPSPAQSSTSPTHNSDFPLPASKRPRLSPPLSAPFPQAQGNYHISPYANNPSPSPGAASTPPLYSNQNSATASPRYNHSTLPQSPRFPNTTPSQPAYTTPYSNGTTTATASVSIPPHSAASKFATSTYPPQNFTQNSQSHQAQNQFAIQYNQGAQGHPNNMNNMAGNMGPPMKPPEKPAAEEDQTDVLTGTGINLREEEAYSQNQFAYSQNSASQAPFSSQNYTPYTTGSEGAFYGSGPASQVADDTLNKSQEEIERQVQEDAWHRAAHLLAQSRQEELADPFSQPKYMMSKMDRIARKAGIRINTSGGSMGRLRVPGVDYDALIGITTAPTRDKQALTVTDGTILPVDGLVVDQIILLSLAAKLRTRGLLEDVVKVAKGRQMGSSGIVPTEWADIAVPVTGADGTIASVDPEAPRPGWESAISPHTSTATSLKRKSTESSANRLPTPISDGNKTPVPAKYPLTNEVAKALRDVADQERQFEERRLEKRKRRADGTHGTSSAAPGTPGSVPSPAGTTAPKAPTRKEMEKKNKEKKKEDAASNASANATSNMFLKGKKYSWMKSGGASGAASYIGMNAAASGVRAAAAVPEAPVELTQRGSTRLGMWREDKSLGEKIQMRDWVAVLEQDGRANKEYQKLMLWLDNPKVKEDEPEAQ